MGKKQGIGMGRVEEYIKEGIEKKGGLLFAVIDPLDYKHPEHAIKTAFNAGEGGADVILVGGSTGVQGELLDNVVKEIKSRVSVPVVLFPGNIATITKYADALYFMSLLNSRNPYWITRAQMLAAPVVRRYGIEALPTAYVVVEPGGTVGVVGEVELIPREKPKLAAAYAMAAELMGFRFFITDAGSNPKTGHVPLEMVSAVRGSISIPYIVAGGIKTPEDAKNVVKAGADAVQVGTAFEEDGSKEKIEKMVKAIREGAKLRR
jgi:phosphoglycerol geranylgeranyltransferase